jgi:hypothetical protein
MLLHGSKAVARQLPMLKERGEMKNESETGSSPSELALRTIIVDGLGGRSSSREKEKEREKRPTGPAGFGRAPSRSDMLGALSRAHLPGVSVPTTKIPDGSYATRCGVRDSRRS